MVLQIGVIGAGGMGREHITNLAALPGVEVAVVADVIANSAKSAAALVGAEPTTDSFAVLSRSDLDGVVIASPDETHAELTIAALGRGLPVLCEKPLAVSVNDALRVVEAERAGTRPLVQVGFMRQYDPAHLQVVDAIAELGPIQHVRAVHRNTNHDWTRPLDVIVSQSVIHDIHTVRWLTRSEFASVTTAVARTTDKIDHLVVLGSMQSGAVVTLEFSEATYGYDVEVDVTCAHGMVSAAQPAQPQVRRTAAVHRHIGEDWFGRFTTAYQREIADWIASVRSGVQRGPTASDGLTAQRVASAIIESGRTGGSIDIASKHAGPG